MAVGGNGTFSSFLVVSGLMMAGSLKMVLRSELIMFCRLLVIFNSLLSFEMRDIGLVSYTASPIHCIFHTSTLREQDITRVRRINSKS